MPTAETTLFPAYSARSRRLLTSSVRLDNKANFGRGALAQYAAAIVQRRHNAALQPCRFDVAHADNVDTIGAGVITGMQLRSD